MPYVLGTFYYATGIQHKFTASFKDTNVLWVSSGISQSLSPGTMVTSIFHMRNR